MTKTTDSSKRTPRPRELKMINALVSGEAKTISAAMVQAGFNPTSRSVRDEFLPGRNLHKQLMDALEEAGITLPFMTKKLYAKIEAKKHMTIAGEATEVDDNDAQLRALDIAIKLHDRAGTLPAMSESGGNGSTITVNVLVMNDPAGNAEN